MIKLRNFFKSFGPKNVLRSLDLDVESGEIVTIRGKNGSGKTTLLKALSTLEKPDDYDLAEIDGFDLVRNSEEVRARVGFLSHNPPYYPELTGLENLDFWLDLHPGNYDSNYSGELLAQVGLIMFKDDMAGNYSRGMIQRLGFAIAIAHSPTTLLLDEPLTGLDDDGSQIIEDHLLRLKDNGCSILLSSHDEISFADRVLELEDGALK
ncbi:MAG: ABC transporter ATP-binding protein [Methanobacteriota archaeon]|jgi:ABC-type multidrug transport system ATPase subunit|nr:ABC transporter ATP-binding protein [Candidatus Thermoplasmatota archaeon]MEC8073074.1 ABC transporter ATP-binding protein [Candidatus Thermoplasmatota archaeon]MEC8077205.1 ABC transporter ATP-binding protein [Candidatus Thermoplasmatota archaeon]MEC8446671.1 ABC transporter ATP-binding protein [Candidatus Thermoplasmatota archaeon]GIR27136.1 MAG: ABC transporter ATP-binding protein [Euryarchaeota archaeon]